MYKTNVMGNLKVFILIISLFLVIALSTNSVTAADDTILKHQKTVSSGNHNLNAHFEGSSGDDWNRSPYKIEITKINGQTWSGGDIYLHPGSKLQVEAKLSWYYPWGWGAAGWRNLNFYLATSPDSGVVWKKEGILTNLFTGKASVTIDTKGLTLNQPTYQLCAYYGCTPEDRYWKWGLGYNIAWIYTPVKLDILPVGSSPPGNNPSNYDNSQNTNENAGKNTSEPINATTVPMQDTGTPLGSAILGLIGIISSTVYGRIR